MTNKLLLFLVHLLPSCSLLFQPTATMGADGGGPQESTQTDGAPDSSVNVPDASDFDGPVQPAADASECDPFDPLADATCYVGNYPLAGPQSYGEVGEGLRYSSCTLSFQCQPGMFCTGVGGSPGECLTLCDGSHSCNGGAACLSINWHGFGFCEKQF